ncbi:MAG TPA: aldehyde dehydrogenase family protein [Candidatus Binatus sp.]|nr:aldehyde dehydrogenase family protein [Candidatus Binatus sp.]
MSVQAPRKQPKITYSGVGGNLDEIHAAFDAALERVRAELGKTHHPFINGREAKGEGPALEWHSPIDSGLRIGKFQSASPAQIDAAVAAARTARKQWASLPWTERVAILRRAAENIRERRYDIAALMSIEVGKNRIESLGDAEEAADLIDYYADQVANADGYRRPLGQLSPNEQTQDALRPYGVFAVISPFNFPLALATGMSSAALLAGNTVVLKPSVMASLTGSKLAQAYHDAGMPAGTFNLVYGSGEGVGQPLLHHAGIDGVAFTGSHEVGMQILRDVGASGAYAKPVLGELGGKNAAIVTATADLDMAAEGVMRSAFGYQGQKCSACSRVYVEEGVADDFIARLLERTEKIAIGDPSRREVWFGPVINDAAVRKFEEAASTARRAGTMLVGGERLSGDGLERGNYVEPTIVKLPLDHELYQRELFLPFLAVGIVPSFDRGLEESNRPKLGLTGGLFSNDDRQIERFFDEMEAGVLYVNRRSGATTGAWPGVQSFCGWKGSGVTGKGGCGPFYVEQFMREQSRTRML